MGILALVDIVPTGNALCHATDIDVITTSSAVAMAIAQLERYPIDWRSR